MILERVSTAAGQLDWAIRLFLDHQAYIPAITLAGASEECLGKLLGERSSHARLSFWLLSVHSQKPEILNELRNWLKHGSAGSTFDADDLEEYAIAMICRAGSNLMQIDHNLFSERERFDRWLGAQGRYSDLR